MILQIVRETYEQNIIINMRDTLLLSKTNYTYTVKSKHNSMC